MATYKVLQDIEAEDKILGPLTLKQFVFAIITIAIGFVGFQLLSTTGLGLVRYLLVFILLPPFLVFGFLASPIGRDQPNDVWLLARLRYILKPHKRIWDQDGMSNLVTITAPKHDEKRLTDDLNQQEVTSRLKALANTLDSRGWAVKNVDADTYKSADFLVQTSIGSDRLIDPSNIAVVTPEENSSVVDVLDESSSRVAQKLGEMVEKSEADHRQQVIQSMQQQQTTPVNDPNFWFNNAPQNPTPQHPAVEAPSVPPNTPEQTQTTQTNIANPAIINLAGSNDLNVATIQRQASHIDEQDQEVVININR